MHEIDNLNINLASYSVDSAIVSYFKNEFPEQLDEILNELFPKNKFIRIDNLSIEINVEDFIDLDYKGKKRILANLIRTKINLNNELGVEEYSEVALLLFFLRKGYHRFESIDEKLLVGNTINNYFSSLLTKINNEVRYEILLDALIKLIDKYDLYYQIRLDKKSDNDLFSKLFIKSNTDLKLSTKRKLLKIVLEHFSSNKSDSKKSIKQFVLSKLHKISQKDVDESAKILAILGKPLSSNELKFQSILQSKEISSFLAADTTFNYEKFVGWLSSQKLLEQLDKDAVLSIIEIIGDERFIVLIKDIEEDKLKSNLSLFLNWVFSYSKLIQQKKLDDLLIAFFKSLTTELINKDLVESFLKLLQHFDKQSFIKLSTNYLSNVNRYSRINRKNLNKIKELDSFAISWITKNVNQESSVIIKSLLFYVEYGIVANYEIQIPLTHDTWKSLNAELSKSTSQKTVSQLKLSRLFKIISGKEFFSYVKSIWARFKYPSLLINKIDDKIHSFNENVTYGVSQFLVDSTERIYKLANDDEVERLYKEISTFWLGSINISKKDAESTLIVFENVISTLYQLIDEWEDGKKPQFDTTTKNSFELTLLSESEEVVRYIETKKQPITVLTQLLNQFSLSKSYHIIQQFFKYDKGFKLLVEQTDMLPTEEMRMAVIQNFLTVREAKAKSITKDIFDADDSQKTKLATKDTVHTAFSVWLNYFLLTNKTLYNKSKLEEILIASNAEILTDTIARLSKKDRNNVLVWLTHHLRFEIVEELISSVFGHKNALNRWKSLVKRTKSIEKKIKLTKLYISNDGEELSVEEGSLVPKDNQLNLYESSDNFSLLITYLKQGYWTSLVATLEDITQDIINTKFKDLIDFINDYEEKNLVLLRILFNFKKEYILKILSSIYEDSQVISLITILYDETSNETIWKFKLALNFHDQQFLITDAALLNTIFENVKEDNRFKFSVSSSEILQLVQEFIVYDKLRLNQQILLLHSLTNTDLKNELVYQLFVLSFTRFSSITQLKDEKSAYLKDLYFTLTTNERQKLWIEWFYASSNMPVDNKRILVSVIQEETSFGDIEPSLFFNIDPKSTFFSKSTIDKSLSVLELSLLDTNIAVSDKSPFNANFSPLPIILNQPISNEQLATLKKYKKSELVEIAHDLFKFISKNIETEFHEDEFKKLNKNELISLINDISKSSLSLYQIYDIIVNTYFLKEYDKDFNQVNSALEYFALYNKFNESRDLNYIAYLSDYKLKFIRWLEEERLLFTFYATLGKVIGKINAFEWLYSYVSEGNKSILEHSLLEEDTVLNTLDSVYKRDIVNETTIITTSEVYSDVLTDLYTADYFLNFLISNYENNTLSEINVKQVLQQLTTRTSLTNTKSLTLINWYGKFTFLLFIFEQLTFKSFLLVLSYILPNAFRFLVLYERTWNKYFLNYGSTKNNRKFFVHSVIDLFINDQIKLNDEAIFYKIFQKYILINDIDIKSLYALLPKKLRKQLSDSISSASALVGSANYSEYDKLNSELVSILQIPDSVDIEDTDLTFLSLDNATDYSKYKRLDLLWDDISNLQSETDLLTNWVQTLPIQTSFKLIQNWLKLNPKAAIKDKLGSLYPEKMKHIVNERKNLSLVLNDSLLVFYDVIAIYFLLAFKNQFNTQNSLQNYLSHLSATQQSEVSQLVQTRKSSLSENAFFIKFEEELKVVSPTFLFENDTIKPTSTVGDVKELEISDIANISDTDFKQKIPSLINRLTALIVQKPKNQNEKEELAFLWEALTKRLGNIEELLVALKANQSIELWIIIQLRLSENEMLNPIVYRFEGRFPALIKAKNLAKDWLNRFELGLSESQLELRLWSLISFHFDKNYPLAQLLKDFVIELPLQFSVVLFQQMKAEEKKKEQLGEADDKNALSDDKQRSIDQVDTVELKVIESQIREQLQDQLIENREEEAFSSLSVINPKLYKIDQDIIREQFFDYISHGYFKNVTAKPVFSFSSWLKNLDRLLDDELIPIKKRVGQLVQHANFVENVINRTNILFKLWLLEWFIPFLLNNKVVAENLNLVRPVIKKYRPNWNYETIINEFTKSYLLHFIGKESFTLSEWTAQVLGNIDALSAEDIAKLDKHTTPSSLSNDELSVVEKIDRKELVIEDEPLEGLIHLPYAGIVILGPYLARLFDLLGYLKEDKKSFLNVEKACRAVYALAFLNGKEEALNEPEYLIHKILCGLPLALPLPPMPELLESEKNTMLSMLNGVKNNWPKMQRSSIEAMQQSFLNREGSLSFHENYWQVQIEKQTMDILMQSIPWSFAKIKLSWMEHPINVEWI